MIDDDTLNGVGVSSLPTLCPGYYNSTTAPHVIRGTKLAAARSKIQNGLEKIPRLQYNRTCLKSKSALVIFVRFLSNGGESNERVKHGGGARNWHRNKRIYFSHHKLGFRFFHFVFFFWVELSSLGF